MDKLRELFDDALLKCEHANELQVRQSVVAALALAIRTKRRITLATAKAIYHEVTGDTTKLRFNQLSGPVMRKHEMKKTAKKSQKQKQEHGQ